MGMLADVILLDLANLLSAGDGQAASGKANIVARDADFGGRAGGVVAVKKVRWDLKQLADLLFQSHFGKK